VNERATGTIQQCAEEDAAGLERMVGTDPHRPGSADARLVAEQIPVWAIVGHVTALASASTPGEITEATINAAAHDYDIPPVAVVAALRYYDRHRAAIDARLEANAAALS